MRVEVAMTLVTTIPLACELLDRCIAWARHRWQVEIDEGGIYPPSRLVCWLRVKHRDPGYDHDVILIRLPSYEWQPDFNRDNHGDWAQLVLMRRGRFTNRAFEARARKLWSVHWIGVSYLA
jgi:hypothetical protein